MPNDNETPATTEAAATADAAATAKPKKQKVSERIVLGADNTESDTYVGATGALYKSVSEKGADAVVYFKMPTSGLPEGAEPPKLLPTEMVEALAAFGFLTLAGNVTNVIRNGTPKADGPQTEADALAAWLEDLFAGNWTKASGEVEPGMGLLAEAVARTLSDNDKKDRTSPEAIAKVKDWLAGLDKEARAKWRGDLRVKRHQTAIHNERAAKRAEGVTSALPDAPTDI
jgi:hypothetical protein